MRRTIAREQGKAHCDLHQLAIIHGLLHAVLHIMTQQTAYDCYEWRQGENSDVIAAFLTCHVPPGHWKPKSTWLYYILNQMKKTTLTTPMAELHQILWHMMSLKQQ